MNGSKLFMVGNAHQSTPPANWQWVLAHDEEEAKLIYVEAGYARKTSQVTYVKDHTWSHITRPEHQTLLSLSEGFAKGVVRVEVWFDEAAGEVKLLWKCDPRPAA